MFLIVKFIYFFFFSSRRRHTRLVSDWSSDVCSSELLDDRDLEERDKRAIEVVDEAQAFAEQSPEPALESLYENVYVLGDQVQGWYSVDERTPEVHRGEDEHEVGKAGVAHELAEAGAAYAGAGDVQRRRRREGDDDKPADAAQKGDDGQET